MSWSLRKQSGLTVRAPSPSLPLPPPIPAASSSHLPVPNSPRRAPLPPSPTHSTYSVVSGVSNASASTSNVNLAYDDNRPGHSRRGSLEWGRDGPLMPSVSKSANDKRFPMAPPPPLGIVPPSPSRKDLGPRGGAGMYDTKLVSSTLSQVPPIPLSPTPTGSSGLGFHHHNNNSAPSSMSSKPSFASLTGGGSTPRPSLSPNASSSVVVLPDGTALPSLPDTSFSQERSLHDAMAHSSPNSPWSLLTVHVLPLFAGGPLKSAIEDLNALCHSHIVATSQRTPASRLSAVLGSDLRDFIASGMLTLKAKIEAVDEAKIIPRAAEVWGFFWSQVLPYLEAVFLPFHQLRDMPTSSSQSSSSSISVRHILLSGFLVHILLPLLPRLIPIITMNQSAAASLCAEAARSAQTPSTQDLQRILQMSLVLSTQAKFSSCVPQAVGPEGDRRDMEVRENVDGLGKAVRWRTSIISSRAAEKANGTGAAQGEAANRPTAALNRAPSLLQRGPSMSQQARPRRRGWRTSSALGIPAANSDAPQPSRQNSDMYGGATDSRWGRPRLDEEDEDDNTPNQSLVPNRQDASFATTMMSNSTSMAASTLTAGTMSTVRDGTGFSESQRTPQAEFGRRPVRADSTSSVEATPMAADARRAQRV